MVLSKQDKKCKLYLFGRLFDGYELILLININVFIYQTKYTAFKNKFIKIENM